MTNGTLPEPGADTGTPAPPRAMQGAVADRITLRYKSLPLVIRIYILGAALGGVGSAIYYIFLPSPPLDLTYYFFLMAMFLPTAYLLSPAHEHEATVGWLSYTPAVLALGVTLFLSTQGRVMMFTLVLPGAAHVRAGPGSRRRFGGLIFTGIVLFLGLYPVFAEYMWGSSGVRHFRFRGPSASIFIPATR